MVAAAAAMAPVPGAESSSEESSLEEPSLDEGDCERRPGKESASDRDLLSWPLWFGETQSSSSSSSSETTEINSFLIGVGEEDDALDGEVYTGD